MNNDGFLDIVSGSWDGELFLIPGRKDSSFGEPEIIKHRNGDEIFVGKASVIVLEDWDRDGDLDLTVGTIDGEVYFIPSESGQFGAPVELKAAGETIEGHHGGPELADWDGNGTIDLLLADGDGRVRFFPNETAEGVPQLGAAVELIPVAGESTDVPGIRAKIDVVDYNGDGKLDLLLGDAHFGLREELELTEAEITAKSKADAGYISVAEKMSTLYLEQIQPEVEERLGISDLRATEWDVTMKGKYHNVLKAVIKSNPEYLALNEEAGRWMEARSKYFAPSKSHGYVWVFLRKN